jgi:hypothetical protein
MARACSPRSTRPAALLLGLVLASCSGDNARRLSTDFIVSVGTETFVFRTTHPETIVLGFETMNGRGRLFPIGPLRRGNGGFNAPWSWHLDPAETRLTEVAIEVCDGTPSYVEAHVDDFVPVGYCPWSARIIGIRP